MSIIRGLFLKWFGLSEPPCESCEILRSMLDESNRERKDLLHRLLTPPQVESPPAREEEFKPVTPNFIPWRVRQQILEQEDRKTAQLLRDKKTELSASRDNKESVEALEKELGIPAVGE